MAHRRGNKGLARKGKEVSLEYGTTCKREKPEAFGIKDDSK
jgi:hypothetical protein